MEIAQHKIYVTGKWALTKPDAEKQNFEVEAFCVGGVEGVFAVYQVPGQPDLIGFAAGDDGFWREIGSYSKGWLPLIQEALACMRYLK